MAPSPPPTETPDTRRGRAVVFPADSQLIRAGGRTRDDRFLLHSSALPCGAALSAFSFSTSPPPSTMTIVSLAAVAAKALAFQSSHSLNYFNNCPFPLYRISFICSATSDQTRPPSTTDRLECRAETVMRTTIQSR